MPDFKPTMKDYKKLTPFKFQILQSFPFIAEDFDSLTNYELLCKVVEYLNDVIKNENNVEDNVTALYNSFVVLQNYVNNYFDNLDVQEEINNKLDAMVADGTFDTIINKKLFTELNNQLTANTTNIENIKSYLEKDNTLSVLPTIFVGDSYLVGVASNNRSYGDIYKELVNLDDNNYYKFASPGAGFVATGSGGKNFYNVLNENIKNVTNKNEIKQIIVGCGYNDAAYQSTYDRIKTEMKSFINLCTANFPNAKIYLIGCGYNKAMSDDGAQKRYLMAKIVTYAYSEYSNEKICYIDGSNLWLHNDDYMATDNIHPILLGQEVIAKKLIKYLKGQSWNEQINTDIDVNVLGVTSSLTANMYNNHTFIETKNITIESNIPSIDTSLFNEIGSFTSKYIHPSSNSILRFNTNVLFIDSVIGWKYLENVEISLLPNGKIYMYSRCLNNENNGFLKFDNLTRIIIYPTQFTLPTILI